jgi:hypothetical protein
MVCLPKGISVETYTSMTYIHISMQTVVETEDYLRDAKASGLTASEREAIITTLADAPDSGDLIPGTGGARKLRVAAKGKGKSGGYRVITFYAGTSIPVFLLNVFAKNERVDLTQAERNELRAVLAEMVHAYRKQRSN